VSVTRADKAKVAEALKKRKVRWMWASDADGDIAEANNKNNCAGSD
jgi:hypothetical protein